MNNVHAALLALTLYGAQCILSIGWSLLFFTLQRPDIALWELAALDLVLVGMVWSYGRTTIGGHCYLEPAQKIFILPMRPPALGRNFLSEFPRAE